MKKIILLVILTGTLLTLGGCKAKETEAQADLVDLGAQPASQTVEAYGVIKASNIEDIVIGFNAAINQINIKNGQRVAAGDTLMVLNIDDYNSLLSQQECDIAVQKEQLKQQKEQTQKQKEQKDLTKEQKSLIEDQEKLMKEQEEKLSALEDSLALQRSKLEQAHFSQEKVISDIADGVVFNMGFEDGDMIYSGYKLFSIADLSSLIVTADIDQQFISWVSIGAKVDIIPEYDKNTVIKGTVSFISTKAFSNNGETVIPIEITIDPKAEGLILDADAEIKIYPAEQSQ